MSFFKKFFKKKKKKISYKQKSKHIIFGISKQDREDSDSEDEGTPLNKYYSINKYTEEIINLDEIRLEKNLEQDKSETYKDQLSQLIEEISKREFKNLARKFLKISNSNNDGAAKTIAQYYQKALQLYCYIVYGNNPNLHKTKCCKNQYSEILNYIKQIFDITKDENLNLFVNFLIEEDKLLVIRQKIKQAQQNLPKTSQLDLMPNALQKIVDSYNKNTINKKKKKKSKNLKKEIEDEITIEENSKLLFPQNALNVLKNVFMFLAQITPEKIYTLNFDELITIQNNNITENAQIDRLKNALMPAKGETKKNCSFEFKNLEKLKNKDITENQINKFEKTLDSLAKKTQKKAKTFNFEMLRYFKNHNIKENKQIDESIKKIETAFANYYTNIHIFVGAQLLYLFKHCDNVRMIHSLLDGIKDICQQRLSSISLNLQLRDIWIKKLGELLGYGFIIKKDTQNKLPTKNNEKNITKLLNILKITNKQDKIKHYLKNVFKFYNEKSFTQYIKYFTKPQKMPENILGLTFEVLQHIYKNFSFTATVNQKNKTFTDTDIDKCKNLFVYTMLFNLEKLAKKNSGRINIKKHLQQFLSRLLPELLKLLKLEQARIKIDKKFTTQLYSIFARIIYKNAFKNAKKFTKHLKISKAFFFASYTNDYHLKLWLEKLSKFNIDEWRNKTIPKAITKKPTPPKETLSFYSPSSSLNPKKLQGKSLAFLLAFLACKKIICNTHLKDMFKNYDKKMKGNYKSQRMRLAKTIIEKLQDKKFCDKIKTQANFIAQLKILIKNLNTANVNFAEKLPQQVTKYLIQAKIIGNDKQKLSIQPLQKSEPQEIIQELCKYANKQKDKKIAKNLKNRIEKLAKSCKLQYNSSKITITI